ncbi:MAG TPA: hypothetical protein VIH57_08960 [Bacteroidales bacterium]
MINRYLLSFSFLTVLSFSCYGQKFVSDSLVVNFGTAGLQKINATIDTVIDQRNLKPNCIAITERKRYFNVPIDYRILTSKPLYAGFTEMFSNKPDSLTYGKYMLEIKEFVINSEPDFFKNKYTCNSIISVYSVKDHKKTYKGALVYETQHAVKKSKKQPQKEYETFIDFWKIGFIADMNAIVRLSTVDSTFSLPNLIKQSDFRKNMILSSDIALGLDSWLIDGEIMFSRPEPGPQFFRRGNTLRYRHEKRYESLEFSIANKQYNYRLNPKFLFLFKSNLFWGLNCWNNNEFSKHGLQDIFLLDFSASQHILYNPFYKRSIIFGLGIMEDVTYIYSEETKFKPYLVLQIGIKL